jgi:hypothetical protein
MHGYRAEFDTYGLAELLNSNTEIAHMFVELSTADLVCGSPFRFLTIRNYLLNAPPLRVRSGAP